MARKRHAKKRLGIKDVPEEETIDTICLDGADVVTAVDLSKNTGNTVNSETKNKFVVEYAVSGRAKCKKCNKKIDTGNVRIGKWNLFKTK